MHQKRRKKEKYKNNKPDSGFFFFKKEQNRNEKSYCKKVIPIQTNTGILKKGTKLKKNTQVDPFQQKPTG